MAAITRDIERRRLIIRPDTYEEGNVLRALPTRRWMPTKGVFIVPLTRLNAKGLVDAAERGEMALIEVPGHEGAILVGSSGERELRAALNAVAYPPASRREWPADFPFSNTPYPDQLRALQKCYNHDTFALLMRPGSGKTMVVVNMLSKHAAEGRIGLGVVVCPLTVAPVWIYNEIRKHSPQGMTWRVRLFESAQYQTNTTDVPLLDWWVIGVESFSQGGAADRLQAALEKDGRPYAMVVDESHTIKTHNAVRSQRVIDVGKNAVVRGIMTGTAVTRSLIDLYSQYQFLDPNIIGIDDWFAFRNRYCVMGGYKKKEIVAYDRVDELMGFIEPYTYRCDKPKGLPEQRWQDLPVEMSEFQRKMYDRVRNAEVPEISVANILNRIAKLQQVAGGYLRSDPKTGINPITGRKAKIPGEVVWELPEAHNPKLKRLRALMEEASDQQIIVWCKGLWEIEQVYMVLAEFGSTAKLIGETSVEERARIQADFQRGHIRHLVGNAQTGGIGITLTASHLGVFYSNTYSMVDRIQAQDRQHRIGQHHDVLYLDLMLMRSVDQLIKAAIQEHLDLDQYIAKKLDEAQGNTAKVQELLGGVI